MVWYFQQNSVNICQINVNALFNNKHWLDDYEKKDNVKDLILINLAFLFQDVHQRRDNCVLIVVSKHPMAHLIANAGRDIYCKQMDTIALVHNQTCSWWRHQMETFRRYWPFVLGIHRSPVNSPHKGQWRGALMFSLICVCINGWVNKRKAGDLRRHSDVKPQLNCWHFVDDLFKCISLKKNILIMLYWRLILRIQFALGCLWFR